MTGAGLRCPVCRSHDVDAASDGVAPRLDASNAGSIRTSIPKPAIAVCRACGLGWQTRPPNAESLEEAYAGLADRTYVAEEANRSRTAALAAWVVARHARHARLRGALLDVGCSAGYFVEAAVKRGFDATGVEPSRWLSDLARARVGGDRVLHGTFEKVTLRPASYDVVTMWDVLEHTADPIAFLARAREVLRPGGLVVIDVPARDTWTARLLGSRWPLLLPEHLFYFSRASLRIALEAAGFEAPRLRPHVVFFSAGYVAHRLSQHDAGLVSLAGRVARRLVGSSASIPLVMGERTAIARAR